MPMDGVQCEEGLEHFKTYGLAAQNMVDFQAETAKAEIAQLGQSLGGWWRAWSTPTQLPGADNTAPESEQEKGRKCEAHHVAWEEGDMQRKMRKAACPRNGTGTRRRADSRRACARSAPWSTSDSASHSLAPGQIATASRPTRWRASRCAEPMPRRSGSGRPQADRASQQTVEPPTPPVMAGELQDFLREKREELERS